MHTNVFHYDAIKWKHFPRYWYFCEKNPPVAAYYDILLMIVYHMLALKQFEADHAYFLIKLLKKELRSRWNVTIEVNLTHHNWTLEIC